jgi:AcrR family transcriptional regulator
LFMRTTEVRGAAASATRERILAAALAMFAERGFDGASTRQIAQQAGVPQGLLGYHFGDKLGLWKATVDFAFGEIRRDLDEAEPQPAVEGEGQEVAVFRAAVRAHVHFVARHPEFVRLMYDEGKRRGPRMRWIVDRHARPTQERILPMIEKLQSLGRLPADIPPRHFVYAMVGAINTLFHQAEEYRRLTGTDPFSEASVEAHARAVEYLLLGPPPNGK